MVNASRALVLGATGQIGRPVVTALAEDGWEVTAASRGGGRDARWPEGVGTLTLDREEPGALEEAVGDGYDLLVDMTAMTAGHARQITGLADRLGSAVVFSSGAVYEDDQGRSFATQAEPDGWPRYPVPVPETARTVAPGEEDYGSLKVLIENQLTGLGDRLPVTMLRASAVYGPYCRTPRELWFVKRWLDGRRVRVLAHGGESRFHPASVRNIAELVRLSALKPGARVLNAADPEAPTVARIGELHDQVLGWECETVLLEGAPPKEEPMVGITPWSLPFPLVLDMAAAERELGYRPVTTYEQALPETLEWLVGQVRGRDWREALPKMAANYDPIGELFDYAAEDRWLERHRG
ncbi:NAD-dependent epimerase/dehydratase family protein [Streptomyces albus subsp. chlorinus]|uniref:NAD-dependent epimerase/dehydratase family protein n=1 Tax=Streptomyces albus TaxID=1888 RepID=UPI001570E129|nr:NAD-dependent epimerase/dehydratase family protein [Streptomyces albus]NSC20347.1 NAD-dependent epimerase/dehydratase family protein [Streptomyces albus subsp. chlorinus]